MTRFKYLNAKSSNHVECIFFTFQNRNIITNTLQFCDQKKKRSVSRSDIYENNYELLFRNNCKHTHTHIKFIQNTRLKRSMTRSKNTNTVELLFRTVSVNEYTRVPLNIIV